MRYKTSLSILLVLAIGTLSYFLYPTSLFAPHTITQETVKKLGFIQTAHQDNNTYSIDFDEALWLTGKAAEDAAIRAGRCDESTRNECTPNDYFVENTDISTRPLEVQEDTTIFMETYKTGEPGDAQEKISAKEFADLINTTSLHWNQLPYWIVTQGTRVISIQEQYIP